MKDEDFLKALEKRADETSHLAGDWGSSEKWVRYLSGWLGVHPWRLLVPVSVILAGVLMFLGRASSVKLVGWLQGLF